MAAAKKVLKLGRSRGCLNVQPSKRMTEIMGPIIVVGQGLPVMPIKVREISPLPFPYRTLFQISGSSCFYTCPSLFETFWKDSAPKVDFQSRTSPIYAEKRFLRYVNIIKFFVGHFTLLSYIRFVFTVFMFSYFLYLIKIVSNVCLLDQRSPTFAT